MKKKKEEQLEEDLEEYEDDIEDLEDHAAELETRLEEQIGLANDYLSQLQMARADFDNYQKRVQKEKEQIANIACGELISGLLATLDNFERALNSLEKLPAEEAEGIKKVYKGMLDYLQGCGLEKIAAQGCRFDPNKHEAVMQGEAEDESQDDTVQEEFECGYTFNGRVLRPSKVKVARHSSNASHVARHSSNDSQAARHSSNDGHEAENNENDKNKEQ